MGTRRVPHTSRTGSSHESPVYLSTPGPRTLTLVPLVDPNPFLVHLLPYLSPTLLSPTSPPQRRPYPLPLPLLLLLFQPFP